MTKPAGDEEEEEAPDDDDGGRVEQYIATVASNQQTQMFDLRFWKFWKMNS